MMIRHPYLEMQRKLRKIHIYIFLQMDLQFLLWSAQPLMHGKFIYTFNCICVQFDHFCPNIVRMCVKLDLQFLFIKELENFRRCNKCSQIKPTTFIKNILIKQAMEKDQRSTPSDILYQEQVSRKSWQVLTSSLLSYQLILCIHKLSSNRSVQKSGFILLTAPFKIY